VETRKLLASSAREKLNLGNSSNNTTTALSAVTSALPTLDEEERADGFEPRRTELGPSVEMSETGHHANQPSVPSSSASSWLKKKSSTLSVTSLKFRETFTGATTGGGTHSMSGSATPSTGGGGARGGRADIFASGTGVVDDHVLAENEAAKYDLLFGKNRYVG